MTTYKTKNKTTNATYTFTLCDHCLYGDTQDGVCKPDYGVACSDFLPTLEEVVTHNEYEEDLKMRQSLILEQLREDCDDLFDCYDWSNYNY